MSLKVSWFSCLYYKIDNPGGPWGAPGGPGAPGHPGAPRGTPEAINKSPGVVIHAEFDFQDKTSQYIVKMMKNIHFFKYFEFFFEFWKKLVFIILAMFWPVSTWKSNAAWKTTPGDLFIASGVPRGAPGLPGPRGSPGTPKNITYK